MGPLLDSGVLDVIYGVEPVVLAGLSLYYTVLRTPCNIDGDGAEPARLEHLQLRITQIQ